YLFEHDLVEGIVALPNQLFYNTGISTYIWILTNNKPAYKQGKVKLVNAVDKFEKMRKSLGNKRNKITEEQINEIVEMNGQTEERIERLDDERAFINIAKSRKKGDNKAAEIEAGEKEQATIKDVLANMESNTVYKNRETFIEVIKEAFKETEINLRAPLLRAI